MMMLMIFLGLGLVFNASFNTSSAMIVDKTGVSRENRRIATMIFYDAEQDKRKPQIR